MILRGENDYMTVNSLENIAINSWYLQDLAFDLKIHSETQTFIRAFQCEIKNILPTLLCNMIMTPRKMDNA